MAKNTVGGGLWLGRERLRERRHHTLQDEALPAQHKDRITSESVLGMRGLAETFKLESTLGYIKKLFFTHEHEQFLYPRKPCHE